MAELPIKQIFNGEFVITPDGNCPVFYFSTDFAGKNKISDFYVQLKSGIERPLRYGDEILPRQDVEHNV